MLERLKEYKELIGIVLFVLAGFLWIENSFPSKADLKSEIGVLNCLLEKYMTLTQLQIRTRELEQEMQAQDNQIRLFESPTATLSPAMKVELDGRRQNLGTLKGELKQNGREMQRIADELGRNACARVAA